MKILFILVVAAFAANCAGNPPSKAEIDGAKKRCVDYLYAIQQNGRGWEPPEVDQLKPGDAASQAWGVSAMVAEALIEGGEDPAKSPALKRAIAEIVGGKTNGTYALGLRMQLLANPVFKNKYKRELAADMRNLVEGTVDGRFGYWVVGRKDGGWTDMHSTFYAWSGLYEVRGQVPESAWRGFAQKLLETQKPLPGAPKPAQPLPGYPAPPGASSRSDGGSWCYGPGRDPSVSSTASAMAILLYARQELKAKADRAPIDAALTSGFAYLDGHFGDEAEARGQFFVYTLLKLQFLGKLANRRVIGNEDIGDIGSRWIVNTELRGNWQDHPPYVVAAYLEFLCRL